MTQPLESDQNLIANRQARRAAGFRGSGVEIHSGAPAMPRTARRAAEALSARPHTRRQRKAVNRAMRAMARRDA